MTAGNLLTEKLNEPYIEYIVQNVVISLKNKNAPIRAHFI